VPRQQVLARHRSDRRELRGARVGRFLAVAELARLARGDPGGVVVAPRDAGVDLVLRDRELLLADPGAACQLEPGREDLVEALLQAVPADGRGVEPGAALDAGA